MLKKLLPCVLALVLAFSLSVPAFAAGDNTFGPGDTTGKGTTVTYTVDPTYTVTIPASVTLGGSVTVEASNVMVARGKRVVVKLTGTGEADDAFKVKTSEGAELTYTVKNGETPVHVGDAVLTVDPETAASGSTTLTFAAPAAVTYAGTYTGTVTFTVAVE